MKLTQRFGPIPVTVTLDGSGNGTATFQPNGSHARITNLFVKVATSVLQATCTVYKGQIADGNAINTTNSGSTGAAAGGSIDLTDGETLYVRWLGGDAGATATATFTGITIPFDQVGPSHLDWADPIAAGDGSLVYPALKSPNFVTGLTGWKIDRTGNAEFNDVDIRGTLEVVGVDGSYIRIEDSSGTPFIELRPDDTSVPYNYQQALIYAYSDNLSTDSTALVLQSPTFDTNKKTSSVYLNGQDNTLSTPYVEISPRITLPQTIFGESTIELGSKVMSKSRVSASLIDVATSAVSSAAIGAETAVLTTTGGKTYLANQAYRVTVTARFQPAIDNRAAAWAAGIPIGRAIFRIRKTNVAGQLLLDVGRFTGLTPEPYCCNFSGVFVVGGSDVTGNISCTLNSGSGAGVNDITMLGTGTGGSRSLEIHYEGLAADYPNAAILV